MPMRILAGYDGSVQADGVLYDLARAGLPERAEAVVLTATVPWMPYGPGGDPAEAAWSSEAMAGSREYTRQALEEAKGLAERGARFLRGRFPEWKVKAESVADHPAQALLAKAEAWGADLLVLGTHGRSRLGRFLLGSVSHKVIHHAPCSLRVARPRLARRFARAPLLVLGLDGSAGSVLALETLATREWPKGTEVRVVAVAEPGLPPGRRRARKGEPASGGQAVLERLERLCEAAGARLAEAGLRAVPSVDAGDPREVLLREASEWEAQAVFVGARGTNPSGRYVLGGVAAALAEHAPCTVEIAKAKVRARRSR